MTRRRGLAPVANQEHRVLELQLPLRLLFLGSQSVMSPILATFVNHLSKSVHIQAGTTNHLGLTCHVVQLRLPLHQLLQDSCRLPHQLVGQGQRAQQAARQGARRHRHNQIHRIPPRQLHLQCTSGCHSALVATDSLPAWLTIASRHLLPSSAMQLLQEPSWLLV